MTIDYSWVPWFEELFGKITENGEGYPIEAIKSKFPGCEPDEINTFLHKQGSEEPLITEGSNFFHINSNVMQNGEYHWETFKEKNVVYTGGSINTIKKPKRGDIIFVRFGPSEGRGIGVVERNGYNPDSRSSEEGISIYWINKKSRRLSSGMGRGSFRQFDKAGGRYKAFQKAYKESFQLIENLQSNNSPSPKSSGETEPEPKVVVPGKDEISPPSLNAILFGPPGTGKTWEATSHAVAIIDGKDPSDLAKKEARDAVKRRFETLKEQGQIEFVTFHQNYAYEDFIEGIRPVLDQSELAYELRNGIFKELALRAGKNSDKRHVLIIDEINRGNIAKIFGELITLIEPSKRLGREDEATATLPYSQESFGVPPNLYILGTMNTADRGIALLDTALRRRFQFIERMPNPELVENDIESVDGQELLKAINRRIRAKLDREHQIGHTYLMNRSTLKQLAEAFQHQILPLLQEYFYDDWEKIRHVLNENPFISKQDSPSSSDDPERHLFDLLPHNDEQWRQADSYRQIYAADKGESGN